MWSCNLGEGVFCVSSDLKFLSPPREDPMGGGGYIPFSVWFWQHFPLVSQALHHWQIVSHTLGVLRLIIWTTNKQTGFKKPSYWQSVITSQNKIKFLMDNSSFSYQLQRPITYQTVKSLFTKTTKIRRIREPIRQLKGRKWYRNS